MAEPLADQVLQRIKQAPELYHKLVLIIGPAGTGKTFLAVSFAMSALENNLVDRIILCRPAVEAGENLGFLPGDMKDKIDPYLRPLYDSLHDLFDYEKIQRKIESGEIEKAAKLARKGFDIWSHGPSLVRAGDLWVKAGDLIQAKDCYEVFLL